MKFYKSVQPLALSSTLINPSNPADLQIDNVASIRGVASTIAYGAMSYYDANQTDSKELLGDLPEPYYWWQAGGLWGAMLDYQHYTGDNSYNNVIIEALTAKVNTGPDADFIPPEHRHEEGNDDRFFWGSAVLSAAERNFPQPIENVPSWLEMSENVWNSFVERWDTKTCGGGLYWQMYADNPNGINYKNSVTNAGFFQISARLARITGEKKYKDWAEKIWNWSRDVGFVSNDYHVYDGAHGEENCKDLNKLSFTYSTGIYIYGAAVMADVTGDKEWAKHAHGMLDAAKKFFKDGVLYEAACEPVNTCNDDRRTFKGYFARFLWQSTYMLSDLKPKVLEYFKPTAKAIARTCTGGSNGDACAQKWTESGFTGDLNLGHQMSSLEVVQGFLIDQTKGPFKGDQVKHVTG